MKLIPILLLLLVILSGCWDQRIVEKMEFITNAGYDARPNGQIKMSITTPSIAGGGPVKPAFYSTIANTPREGRERMSLESFGELDAGKAQQILFGEALAKRGLLEYLEIFSRDPRNPVLARPIVIKGEAGDFIKTSIKWKAKGLPSLYMRNLLNRMSISGNIPDQNVDHFLIDYYAPGMDPILPYIKATPTAAVALGSALFHHDRFVGTLSTEETYFFLVLDGRGPVHISPFFVKHRPNESKRKAMIRFIKNSCRTKLSIKNGTPQVRFDLEFSALIDEWHIDELIQSEHPRRIEFVVARQIQKSMKNLWKKLGQANSDPLGIGDKVRAHHNEYWRSHNWDEVYPKVKADFKVKVSIQRFGVLQ